MYRLKRTGWPVLVFVLFLSACQSEKIDNSMVVGPDEPVSFSQDVLPLFSASCGGSGCHIGSRAAGVGLANYEQTTTSIGNQYGEVIVRPGDSENSPLVDKISPQPRIGSRMPLGRSALSADQVALIRTWIDDGAENN